MHQINNDAKMDATMAGLLFRVVLVVPGIGAAAVAALVVVSVAAAVDLAVAEPRVAGDS